MAASARHYPPALSPILWRVLGLLVLSIWINYIDRANLSVAAPLLTRELHLAPDRMGLLLSAFFWTYALLQPAAGWLADRFRVFNVLALGYLLWSIATAVTGWVQTFELLFLCRLVLGFGESIAYPAYSSILAHHFPRERLALANALIDAGSKLGPAVGTLAGGLLIASWGWRPFFIVLGLGSLLWLWPWMHWTSKVEDRPGGAVATSGPSPGFMDVLRRPEAWAAFIGHFGGNYVWYFLLTWLPTYLTMERKFSMEAMAWFGSMPYVVIAISAVLLGWLSDRLSTRTGSPIRVRAMFAAVGLAGASVIVLVPFTANHAGALAILSVACASYAGFSANNWALVQTLAGPALAGRWTGAQNCFANMAGVVAPALTGYAVALTGKFSAAFGAIAVVLAIGSCGYLFLYWRDGHGRHARLRRG